MGLPEFAYGWGAEHVLCPEDIFPSSGPSPLDIMDTQERAVFASAFAGPSRLAPSERRGGNYRVVDDFSDAALFEEVTWRKT
jgi:hypothetical protein